MSKLIVLDAGPLGLISHPRRNPDADRWFFDLVQARITVAIPEIADYEVRREPLRANRSAGVVRIDALKQSLHYLPITTAIMLQAADFWAQGRRGVPTAPDLALDGDVILAATAAVQIARGDEVVIATTNPRYAAP